MQERENTKTEIKNNRGFRLCVFVLLILCIATGHAYAADKKNVLILNSYHQGYKWTDDEIKGVVNSLFPVSESIKLYIEFMGTKWTFSSDYFSQLALLYKKKFSDTRFDIIISTDDDAFNFLKKYRDEVFGVVPVVFCGLNWLSPGRLAGLKHVTGVNEAADIELNISLMIKLHPEVKKIYVISDLTTTGLAVFDKLNEIIPRYTNRVVIIPLYNNNLKFILNTVSTLQDDSLVFFTIFSQDSEGRFIEYSESCKLVSENSRVPVYGLWDFNLGYGIVGGNLASGYSQGFTAGNLALSILEGKPVNSVKVVMDSPNTYMFDYIQMERFGIKRDMIPAGSVVINEPSSFYSINKRIFQSILLLTLLFAAFTMALAINIRRRHYAEKIMRESEEKYRSLVNNINVGVFRSSGEADGYFIQVNPAMKRIFGYGADDNFFCFPVKELYSDPADRDIFINSLNSSGALQNVEQTMKKKDGTPMVVSISATAVYKEGGRGINWIDGILEDITERKKFEQELRHAQKMDAIGTLTSGIAHDFNNALGGLIGIISIIDYDLRTKRQIPVEKMYEYLALMKESGEKGVNMVKRLLTLAKDIGVDYKAVDINSIVKRVIELLSGIIDRSVNISVEYAKEKAIVFADSSQVEQALLNLCINAGHAMTIMRDKGDKWGGVLSISVSRIMTDKYMCQANPDAVEDEYWCVSVTDTGTGISKDLRERIFEPFFTTKGDGFGTGLGLSMVKKIITGHRGFIDVYSEPGIGTTFNVYLPVSEIEPEYSEEKAVRDIPAGNGLILVAEDEPIMMKIACELLSECGYQTVIAEDGEKAVNIFRERHGEISAVIMDMAMPVMSGITAYREMRIIDPSVKVLITSGFRQDVRVEEVLSMGADGFIDKPYTLERLANALKELLEK